MSQTDINNMLSVLLPFAQEMLTEQGGFNPFGAVLNSADDVTQVAIEIGAEEIDSEEILQALISGLREQIAQDDILVSALCTDVKVRTEEDQQTDAICVQLEHIEGEALDIYMPYCKDDAGQLQFEDLFASQGEHLVFEA